MDQESAELESKELESEELESEGVILRIGRRSPRKISSLAVPISCMAAAIARALNSPSNKGAVPRPTQIPDHFFEFAFILLTPSRLLNLKSPQAFCSFQCPPL